MLNPASSNNKTQKKQQTEYYKRIIEKMPESSPFSINAHLKLGKLYAEKGDKESAINEYSTAAIQYVHNGSLVKAMAVNKMIIELAPEGESALAKISYLYFQQGDITEPPTEYEEDYSQLDEICQELSNQQIMADTLAQIPLFSYLNTTERCKISEFLCSVRAKKRTTIIKEGDVGDCMYLIKSGEVDVYTMLMEREESDLTETDQEQLHLATLKDGDFFGEQALITNEPRNATIIALTDVELLRFAKSDLVAVVRSYPRVEELLRKYHQQRNAATIASLKAALQKLMAQVASKSG